MALTAQAIQNKNLIETEYSEKAAIGALYDELAKGIQSMKNGEVYIVDESWEEIDKIWCIWRNQRRLNLLKILDNSMFVNYYNRKEMGL